MATTGYSATAYHSIPDDADFTLPNGNWAVLAIVKPSDITDGKDIVSTDTYGLIPSFNIYQFDNDYGLKVNGASDRTVTVAASGTWALLVAQRSGTNLSLRVIDMGDTIVENSGTTTLNAEVNASATITIGRRSDNGDNPFQGSISDVMWIPGQTISDSDMQDIASGTAIDSFSWYSSRTFWGILENQTATDQTGNHTITENGSLSTDTDSGDLVRFSETEVSITQAIDENVAQDVGHEKSLTIDSSESDNTAQDITLGKIVSVGMAESSNVAQTILINNVNPPIGTAIAEVIAQDIGGSKQHSIDQSTSSEEAASVFFTKSGVPVIVVPTDPAADMFIIANNSIDTATLTATSTASDFDVDNIKNNDKASGWRSTDLSTQTISCEWATAQTFSGFGIAFSNLMSGSTVQLKYYTLPSDPSAVFDTGALDVNFSYDAPLGFSTIGLTSYSFGGGNYFSTLFSSVTARKLEIILESAGNTDGYMEISKIISGHAITPGRGVSLNARLGLEDRTELERKTNGDMAINLGTKHKQIDFSLNHLPPEDKMVMMGVQRSNGTGRPVFISAHQNDSNAEGVVSYTIFGYFNQAPEFVNFNPDKFLLDLSVVEA